MGRRGDRAVPLGRRVHPGAGLRRGQILAGDSSRHRGVRARALHRHGVLRRVARGHQLGRQEPGAEERGVPHAPGARVQARVSLCVVRRLPRRRSLRVFSRGVHRLWTLSGHSLDTRGRDHRPGSPSRRRG